MGSDSDTKTLKDEGGPVHQHKYKTIHIYHKRHK